MATMNKSIDMTIDSGFSNFSDGFKFKYNKEGEICLATDCSTWAKKLVNNMNLPDYLESEALVPPEVLHFPEFGTREKKKRRKESVGNYIENCEACNNYMDKTFNFYGRLVCDFCINELKKQKCSCGANNRIAEMFCNEGKIYQAQECEDYCLEMTLWNMMRYYCSKCYHEEYALGTYSTMQFEILLQDEEDDEDYDDERRRQDYELLRQEYEYEEDYGEGCRICRGYTAGQDICYYCTVGI